jgi:hypothetical protein
MLTLVVAELLITASCFAHLAEETSCAAGSNIESSNAAAFDVRARSGAGLLMAFSRTLWAYATITEVYALNALLILLVFFLVVRWRRRIIETRTNSGGAVADR